MTSTRSGISPTSSPGSSTVISTATSISCCRGLTESKTSEPWPRTALTVDEVWQIDNDTPGAMGKFRVTGKNDKGEPMDSVGTWTAAYVKEDGKWKPRMLTAAPTPPKKD